MNMKAMILAAGRGERLRPLTDSIPKPLVRVGGYALIEWHIHRLVKAQVTQIVINLSYLGEQIQNYLGTGERYGAELVYSLEPEPALETAGGIIQALAALGKDPFIVINSDIWTDYSFSKLTQSATSQSSLAHLVMVNNPQHNPEGDFILADGKLSENGNHAPLTFSGIGMYRPEFFSNCKPGRAPLAPLLKQQMSVGQVSGEHYKGQWYDIGTLERLEAIQKYVSDLNLNAASQE